MTFGVRSKGKGRRYLPSLCMMTWASSLKLSHKKSCVLSIDLEELKGVLLLCSLLASIPKVCNRYSAAWS